MKTGFLHPFQSQIQGAFSNFSSTLQPQHQIAVYIQNKLHSIQIISLLRHIKSDVIVLETTKICFVTACYQLVGNTM